jgi:hypothetical protein
LIDPKSKGRVKWQTDFIYDYGEKCTKTIAPNGSGNHAVDCLILFSLPSGIMRKCGMEMRRI